MRLLMVAAIALVAGCFQPSTQSCVYQCATQGTPCPSGLVCNSAGMCSAGGTACSGDGGPDLDSPPTSCGDGVRVVGEVCYGAPIELAGPPDGLMDAQLADTDGDGDLDLAYLSIYPAGDFLRFHPQTSPGTFAGSAIQGPAAGRGRLRAVDLSPLAAEELVSVGPGGATAAPRISLWGYEPSTESYRETGGFDVPSMAATTARALAVGSISGGPIGDVVALFETELHIVEISPDLSFAAASRLVEPVTTASDLAVGRLDDDADDDIVVATTDGVTFFRSLPFAALGLSTLIGGQPEAGGEPPTGVAIGDIDGDGQADVVYTRRDNSAQPGAIGVIRANGDGTFAPPQTLDLSRLSGLLDVADIDGDGREDVISLRQLGSEATILVALGNADGTLQAPREIKVSATVSHVHADRDFNGDGMPDLVLSARAEGKVFIVPSNP